MFDASLYPLIRVEVAKSPNSALHPYPLCEAGEAGRYSAFEGGAYEPLFNGCAG